MNVEQQGAAGIGGIGDVHLAAGQSPDQKRIDGAEHQFTAFGSGTCSRNVIENPRDLGAGEVGIKQ